MTKIEEGNINEISSEYKDWFIGEFVNHESFFNSAGTKRFETKWSEKKKGDFYSVKEKPIDNSTCKSMGILISGKFRYSFLNEDNTFKDCILTKQGDYVTWSPDILHETESLEDSVTLTIRWYSS